ncbi:MAG: APC family permease [Acidimicrobiales bacterium]
MRTRTIGDVAEERHPTAEAFGSLWRILMGRPLRRSETEKERINPFEGLSALSLDALTSVAYGPEAIIVVLALAGASAIHLVWPITIVIVGLLVILVVSYRQVIDAYPEGGGAYAVSRANLGKWPSLLAGAAVIVDYVLTVAVSIAAGVGALTSAYPTLHSQTVPICLGILAVITLLNQRGLGEAARAFLLPTVLFIIGIFAVIVIGLVHPFDRNGPLPGHAITSSHALEVVGVLLVLKAFAAGCSALTGVEAIANGVPLFKEPRVERAKRTEALLGTILGAMLLGLAWLAKIWQIGPRSGQTVLSQIIAIALGRHLAYFTISLVVTLVLALAANTSFGGLPVLASLLARDNYLPHLFALRGDRQTFANGIWSLAALSGILLIAVNGVTERLIPLFAIGVFTGFTLAQAGLVVHWAHERSHRWRLRASVNALGALLTGTATGIFLVTKFTSGGWVVVVAVPLFMFTFVRVATYYSRVGRSLALEGTPRPPRARRTLVIVPIVGVTRLAEHAMSDALSIGDDVIAVTVVEKGEGTDSTAQMRENWERWNPDIPLLILESEYASVVQPIVELIGNLCDSRDEQVVVLIPDIVPSKSRYSVLHNHIDFVLSNALRHREDIILARRRVSIEELAAEASEDDATAATTRAKGEPTDAQASDRDR